MRRFIDAYEALPSAFVVSFRMKPGCVPPPGAKPVFMATWFPPFAWGQPPKITADGVARELTRKACDHFKCSPRYLSDYL